MEFREPTSRHFGEQPLLQARDVPQLSRWSVLLAGPGHGELITATTRIHPLARTCLDILAKFTLGIRRGTPLPSPDREGVSLQFVDVVEGISRIAVEARLYLLTRCGTEGSCVPDDLDAFDPLAVLLEIDVLDEEEAAFHPLVGHRSLHFTRHLPRANQPLPEALELGAWLGWLLVSLSVVGAIRHDGFSFLQSSFAPVREAYKRFRRKTQSI